LSWEALKKVNNKNPEEEIYLNPSNEDIKEVFRPIDEKIQNKYHLLNQDIFEQYICFKTLFAYKSTTDVVPKLIDACGWI
jgi:hypothetical protein